MKPQDVPVAASPENPPGSSTGASPAGPASGAGRGSAGPLHAARRALDGTAGKIAVVVAGLLVVFVAAAGGLVSQAVNLGHPDPTLRALDAGHHTSLQIMVEFQEELNAWHETLISGQDAPRGDARRGARGGPGVVRTCGAGHRALRPGVDAIRPDAIRPDAIRPGAIRPGAFRTVSFRTVSFRTVACCHVGRRAACDARRRRPPRARVPSCPTSGRP